MKIGFYTQLLVSGVVILILFFLLSIHPNALTRVPVMVGTVALMAITALSYTVSFRSLSASSPHRFVNGVMAGTLLKLMACIMAAGLWIFLDKAHFHKPDLFALMAVYMIFSGIEANTLSRLSRQK